MPEVMVVGIPAYKQYSLLWPGFCIKQLKVWEPILILPVG